MNTNGQEAEVIYRKVSVKDRLPVLDGRYICFMPSEGNKPYDYYFDGKLFENDDDCIMEGVTHWLEEIPAKSSLLSEKEIEKLKKQVEFFKKAGTNLSEQKKELTIESQEQFREILKLKLEIEQLKSRLFTASQFAQSDNKVGYVEVLDICVWVHTDIDEVDTDFKMIGNKKEIQDTIEYINKNCLRKTHRLEIMETTPHLNSPESEEYNGNEKMAKHIEDFVSSKTAKPLTIEQAKDEVARKYEREDNELYSNWYAVIYDFQRGNITIDFLIKLEDEAIILYSKQVK